MRDSRITSPKNVGLWEEPKKEERLKGKRKTRVWETKKNKNTNTTPKLYQAGGGRGNWEGKTAQRNNPYVCVGGDYKKGGG